MSQLSGDGGSGRSGRSSTWGKTVRKKGPKSPSAAEADAFGQRLFSRAASAGKAKARGPAPKQLQYTRSYTVKKGDTLSSIAERMTGRASNYGSLAKRSGIKNPDLIFPGQKIALPPHRQTPPPRRTTTLGPASKYRANRVMRRGE